MHDGSTPPLDCAHRTPCRGSCAACLSTASMVTAGSASSNAFLIDLRSGLVPLARSARSSWLLAAGYWCWLLAVKDNR